MTEQSCFSVAAFLALGFGLFDSAATCAISCPQSEASSVRVSCMCTGRRSPWQPVATVEIHFVRVVVGRWQRQPLQDTTALTTGALPTAK